MIFHKNNFNIFFLANILFFLAFCVVVFSNHSLSQEVKLKGNIDKIEINQPNNNDILKTSINKSRDKAADIQVLRVAFYYYSDAETKYRILKEQAQKGHPHLLGYYEMDGLYLKAISESKVKEELKIWKYQGGPSPYYIMAGAHIRNNGSAALTDVKLNFGFSFKAAELRVNPNSITTDYSDLNKQAKWSNWFVKKVNLKVVPPGEYMVIYTEDISLCTLMKRLGDKWPINIKVTAKAYSNPNSYKTNDSGTKVLELVPDHFVTRVLR